MQNQPLQKLAYLLVHYSVEVKEKQKIRIGGSTASEPLVKEIYKAVLQAGAFPRVNIQFQDQEYLFYKWCKDFHLDYTDPLELHEVEQIDASIQVFPDLNPHALTAVDAEKKKRKTLAQHPIMETVMNRWAKGDFKWVGAAYPSPFLAQEARMSLEEYKEFVFSSMHLDEDDPIQYWQDFAKNQQKLCDRLNKVKQMRYVGLDTDLTFQCQGRTWINCDGKNNFPDGEVFTGPVEDSVEGTIRFTYPGIFQGEEVEDIFLRFEKGKVVEAKAAKGEKLLHQLLDTDEGAKYAGEIAIGTNNQITRFTKTILFDEKMGGTVHLAIGRGFPDSGSKNISAIHWDMLKDMKDGGEIYADGNLIYKNGKFL